MEESESFSKTPGYCHWVLVIFISLFVYLFIFSVNKFLFTIVKTNFYNLSLLKFFWHAEAVPRGALQVEGVLQMCCKFFGGCICAWVWFQQSCKAALLRSRFCIVILLWVCFVFAEHLSWRKPLEDCCWTKIILRTISNLFFLINYIFEGFKVSVLL